MRNRLLSVTFIAAVAAGSTILACGGGGGGGGGGNPDAKQFKDAKVYLDGAAGATGLGQLCGSAMACPTGAPQCIEVGSGGTPFCTLGCGSSAGSSAPPTNGDATCQAQATGSPGTPACALYQAGSGSSAGVYEWSCAILCGSNGSANLGTCPAGLTCTSNICR
jgi:hypothetical protein